MPTYAVNRDLAGISMDDLGGAQLAAIATADRFRAEGREVRYLRSIFAPATGHCRCLFEGSDADVVRDVQVSASLPYDEILEVLDLPAPAPS